MFCFQESIFSKVFVASPYVFSIKIVWSHQWNWHKRNKIFGDTWCLGLFEHRCTRVDFSCFKLTSLSKLSKIFHWIYLVSKTMLIMDYPYTMWTDFRDFLPLPTPSWTLLLNTGCDNSFFPPLLHSYVVEGERNYCRTL